MATDMDQLNSSSTSRKQKRNGESAQSIRRKRSKTTRESQEDAPSNIPVETENSSKDASKAALAQGPTMQDNPPAPLPVARSNDVQQYVALVDDRHEQDGVEVGDGGDMRRRARRLREPEPKYLVKRRYMKEWQFDMVD